MTDLVDKVCKAMTRYYSNGGDDWGYVEDNDGPYVEPEDHTQFVSYEKAYEAAKRMNARAAIAAVAHELAKRGHWAAHDDLMTKLGLSSPVAPQDAP